MAGGIGSPLSDKVFEQIQRRKEIIGKASGKTDKDQLYLTSKTGWVKMSSGVNTITDEEVIRLRKGKGRKTITGNGELAKTNVLQGGLLSPSGKLRQGLDYTDYSRAIADTDVGSLVSAYSNRSDTTGMRPMPGITGMNVKSKNTYGTLREAEVKLSVWTLEDFELVEKLYLRPGFTILLEWGHTIFLDNSGKVQTIPQTVSQDFFSSGIKMEKLLSEIKTLRQKNSYNYEAMIGYVKNFSWNYTKSGGYECTVSIISTGEIIESMGMRFDPAQRIPIDQISDPDSTLGKLAKKSMYHYFYERLQEYTDDTFTKADVSATASDLMKPLLDFRGYFHKVQHDDTGLIDEDSPTHWVTLRTIFDIFNKHISIIDTSKSPDDPDYAYLKFNTDYLQSSTFVTSPEHFSIDPNVCVLPTEAKVTVPSIDWLATVVTWLTVGTNPASQIKVMNGIDDLDGETYEIRVDAVHDNIVLPEGSAADDVLNILVAVPFLISKIDEILDADGKRTKSVHDIFKAMLDGIETALGGINDFDFVYDEDESTYYLVDRSATPANSSQYPEIPLTGLESIFTEVEISSKISNEMGSQISIAAQGSALNYTDNVENIIRWNPHIVDRIRPVKDTSTQQPAPSEEDVKQIKEKRERTEDWFDDVKTFYDDFNGDWDGYDQEDLEAAKTMHAEWTVENVAQKYKAMQGEAVPGLIPVELALKLDGIGGIKIGEAFKISQGILPRNYQDKFGYIVTGLEHTIGTNNRWETSISTLFYNIQGNAASATIAGASPSGNKGTSPQKRPPTARKVVGGKTRVIEGVKYTNGEIPDNKLRYINNWKSYKGQIGSDGGRIRLYDKASRALDSLLAAATAAGIKFKINSAYRTVSDQERVYDENCSGGVCKPPTARPGTSNHGFGLAVDFANTDKKKMKESFPEYKWLAENGDKYGFRRIASEAWHWEYQNT